MSRFRRRFGLMAVIGAGALVFAYVVSGAVAGANCKKVKGTFTLQSVTGPQCNSGVDICATGTYKGGIAGTSSFTGTSLVQTVDTPTTGVVLLTGDSQFITVSGSLSTKDGIVLKTTRAGEFAEVDTIVGGTGEWAGMTGQFTATGTFTAAAGGGGEYAGEVCTP